MPLDNSFTRILIEAEQQLVLAEKANKLSNILGTSVKLEDDEQVYFDTCTSYLTHNLPTMYENKKMMVLLSQVRKEPKGPFNIQASIIHLKSLILKTPKKVNAFVEAVFQLEEDRNPESTVEKSAT